MVKPILQLVKDDYQAQTEALHGLTDYALRHVVYYVKEILGIDNFRIEIQTGAQPTIIIHVYAEDGQEVYVKLKKSSDLDGLPQYLDMPEYKIKFAEKP